MKYLLPVAFILALPSLPTAAQTSSQVDTGTSRPPPVMAAQVNAELREPVAHGDANAARATMLANAEKICDALSQAFNLTCRINNIQFQNEPRGVPYGRPQPPGHFVFGNVNFQMAPQQ